MIQSVFWIGVVVTVVLVVLSLIFSKVSDGSPVAYYPNLVMLLVGLLLLGCAVMLGKADILGAGFGGVGIAILFATGISFYVTSIFSAKEA